MNKYGLYLSGGICSGVDATWEQYLDCEDVPCREQIVECIMKDIDYLSKFIKPSVLLDFSNALNDPLNGEERYNRLCENLSFVESLREEARALSKEFYTTFFTEVFGEPKPYGMDDSCHILLFPKQKNDHNLSQLIRDHMLFKSWFLAYLSQNKILYSVLIQGANVNDVVKTDIITKLRSQLNTLAYYKMQVAETKKKIEDELSRIDDSMVFEENDKDIIEKAKKELK